MRFRRCTPAGSVHLITSTSSWNITVTSTAYLRYARCGKSVALHSRWRWSAGILSPALAAARKHRCRGTPRRPRSSAPRLRAPACSLRRYPAPGCSTHHGPLPYTVYRCLHPRTLSEWVPWLSVSARYPVIVHLSVNCVLLALPPIVVSPGRADADRREPDPIWPRDHCRATTPPRYRGCLTQMINATTTSAMTPTKWLARLDRRG